MYHIAKGVFDILPQDVEIWRQSHLWQFLECQIRKITSEYNFSEVRTPLFESTELFTRSIGNETDIVKKEMYTFKDLGGRSLTLRPEGTAAVMRAYIEKNLSQLAPIQKFFYICPMFRYERQQAGRYRQHHQFGVEALGSSSAYFDVEVIDLLYTFLSRLGLRGLTLNINSIGSLEHRAAFRSELTRYLSNHLSDLSPESQQRFETNPLRILDSKNEKDQEILQEAPSILDFIDHTYFAQIQEILRQRGIDYRINDRLVRGLDYYNDTVFEITAEELGAQNSLGGGGRYDALVTQLGGPATAACGFGCGLERVLHTMIGQEISLPKRPSVRIFFIPLDDSAKALCFTWLSELRTAHISADMDFSGKKLKNAMRYADQYGADFVAVIGEKERAERQLLLKEMKSGKEEHIPFDNLKKRLMQC